MKKLLTVLLLTICLTSFAQKGKKTTTTATITLPTAGQVIVGITPITVNSGMGSAQVQLLEFNSLWDNAVGILKANSFTSTWPFTFLWNTSNTTKGSKYIQVMITSDNKIIFTQKVNVIVQ
jgi:hypothetical protein